MFQLLLYNARGCLTFISMDIHPSPIPRRVSYPRCRREPSAPTLLLVPRFTHGCACLRPCFPRERKNDPAQTYEAQSSLHSALNHALGSSKGNWLIPALHVVCRNTHRAAALADESTGNRNDHARLQNAVTLLQASYSKTLNDRVELRVSS